MVSGPFPTGPLPVQPVDQATTLRPPSAPTPSTVQQTPPLPSQTPPVPGESPARAQTNGTDRVQISQAAINASVSGQAAPNAPAVTARPPQAGGAPSAPATPVNRRQGPSAPTPTLNPGTPPPTSPAVTQTLQPPGQYVDLSA